MTDSTNETSELGEGNADIAQDDELVEPTNATRSSPFAIASLVVAGIALYGAPRFFLPVPLRLVGSPEIISTLIGVAAEIALAILALWLAHAAHGEIEDSDGRLGGVGFVVAGRIVAIIAIAAAVVGVGVQFLVPETQSPGDLIAPALNDGGVGPAVTPPLPFPFPSGFTPPAPPRPTPPVQR